MIIQYNHFPLHHSADGILDSDWTGGVDEFPKTAAMTAVQL